MMTKFDEEIQEVEARVAREREELVHQAEDLGHTIGHTAREAAISPRGLIAAAAIGFMVGELTRPRRHPRTPQAQPTARGKMGRLGGLLGGAALAFVKSRYGSPAALSRAAWEFAAAQRARRAAATRASKSAIYDSSRPMP